MGKKVLLAFSGGIDSCASVDILRGSGYEVSVITLDMTGNQTIIDNARIKASELDVKFEVIDVRGKFKNEIEQYFINSYLAGETPAPCTVCNPKIKWAALYEIAKERGLDYISTGHYFKIKKHNGKYYVAKGDDPKKDQSYYLWELNQDILSIALTPMGDRHKSEICSVPGKTRNQRESMGVCFLNGESYGNFLTSRGVDVGKGDIVDKSGTVIGHHDGYPFYTIGQKRGMELESGICVTDIDPTNNRLIAGVDSDLYYFDLEVRDYIFSDEESALKSDNISVVIRGIGRNPEGFCKLSILGDKLYITLENPAWAPAKGQPIVLYQDDLVIGGGYLEKYF